MKTLIVASLFAFAPAAALACDGEKQPEQTTTSTTHTKKSDPKTPKKPADKKPTA